MTSPQKKTSPYKQYFQEINVLHGLQSPPEERDWLLGIPKGDVEPVDTLLYLGCNVLRTSHLINTVTDVFKLLGEEFVTVGGPTYCCGIQHFQNGDTEAAKSMAVSTVRGFEKFQPKRVIMWCPSCIYFYDDIMEMREAFSFQHVTQYLLENIDRLNFKPQPEIKVALHYHTGREQSDDVARSAVELLSRVPGVNLVDLGTDARFGRHCTPAVREKVGPEQWNEMAAGYFRRAVDEGVDTFSTLYHGCQRHFCGYERDYPLKVEHYLTVLGRSLGIEHEDLYKKYTLSGDVSAIMEETSPCSLASGIAPEDAKAVIQRVFASPDSTTPV